MRLLVSVACAVEANAALDGGADIVDAKDPRSGALGAVSSETFREIAGAVADRRPVSAAIGDAADEFTIERTASGFAAGGAAFVKVGFSGISCHARVAALAAAAQRGLADARPLADGGPERGGLVLVAYADYQSVGSIDRDALVNIAARHRAIGILLDTADKRGPGLIALVGRHDLSAWIARAQASGLLVAVAGKLAADDLLFASDAGADIAGVRGAACEGGRTGRVSAERVRQLRDRCQLWSAKASAERSVLSNATST